VENTPSPVAVAYLRIHIWAFVLASALTALILGIIAWPIHALMMARAAARYGTYGAWHGGAGPHGSMMMYHGLGPMHAIGLIVVMLWAGVGAAILGALYNAFVGGRKT
jgi:hypothetical protein